MPKSKNSPALFELLRKNRNEASDGLQVPAWVGAPSGTRAQETARTTVRESPSPRNPKDSSGHEEETANVLLVDLDGPLLRISLTPKSGAVVVFALMVLLAMAYVLGRSSAGGGAPPNLEGVGGTSPADEISELQRRPPNPQLVEGLTVGASPTGPRPPAEAVRPASMESRRNVLDSKTAWVKDQTYIVVQEFNAGHADDARRAQEFLAQHGIPTALVVLSGGVIHLTTTEGYNRKDPAQAAKADELLRRVHAVGDKFFASGGRYRLKGYFKTLKEDSW